MNQPPTSHHPQVALVIGAGSVKSAAALGVLQVLQEAHIGVNMVVGSSAGSLIATAVSLGWSIDETITAMQQLWTREVTAQRNHRALLDALNAPDGRFHLRQDALIMERLHAVLGHTAFTDTQIPLTITATDFRSGQPVLLQNGRLVDAIRASIAIPLLFAPHEVNGRLLADGFLSDPLPIGAAMRGGAGVIIAVGFDSPYQRDINSAARFGFQISSILTNNLLHARTAFYNLAHHDDVILIRPQFPQRVRLFDTAKIPMIIEAGAQAMREQLTVLGTEERVLSPEKRVLRTQKRAPHIENKLPSAPPPLRSPAPPPPRSPAPRACKASPPRVTLVLGGGGLKCAASLGVWRLLRQEGITIERVVGCSGGSLYAAAIGLGYSLEKTAELTRQLWQPNVFQQKNRRALLQAVLPGLFGFDDAQFGFVDDTLILQHMRETLGDATFADTKLPVHIVAADVHSGEPVVLSSGSLVDALRASIAIPFALTPWPVNGGRLANDRLANGRLLTDGGVANPTPVDVAVRHGANVIVAVGFMNMENPTLDSAAGVAMHAANILAHNLQQATYAFSSLAHHADVIPVLVTFGEGISLTDTAKIPDIITAGEIAMLRQLPALKQVLGTEN